jgi:enediyne biosynthesis protein E4
VNQNGHYASQGPSAPRRYGKRHRRIAWTLGVLLTTAAATGITTWKIHRDNLPDEYTPGEESADVTTGIATAAIKQAPPAELTPRVEVKSRRIDRLRDPGQRLPPGAPSPLFTDVTREAGLSGFRAFHGPRTSQLPEDMGGGLAWGDYDNDGYDDLLVVGAGAALDAPAEKRSPTQLYRNRGDGTFELDTRFSPPRILGMGAAWADYNNDGWLDLVITGYDAILLFRNERGKLVREARFPSPKGFWTGASWGDYNNDGRPDLYICGYVKYVVDERKSGSATEQFGLEVPYTLNPSSFDAERNLLFRNDGGGRFTEVAAQLGIDNPQGRSMSALWHDFDDDGWLDLYVANDISESKFFLNQNGTFKDAGHSAWVAEYRGSMGLAAGDFDRDGDDDLFISHWIAQGYALYESLAADMKAKSGSGPAPLHFTDVAEVRGVGQPSLQKIGWGAAFADFDSDGWLDLAVANGSTFEDSERKLLPMESFLFWNQQGRFFHDLAPWNQSFSKPRVSRGLAVADFDRDGAVDIAILDLDGGVRLLRNDMPHGNWVSFQLKSKFGYNGGVTGFGDAAKVIAWAGGKPWRTTITSASYLSQHSRQVHIGLGAAESIERLEVWWHGGRKQEFRQIKANRFYEIVEGEPEVRVVEEEEDLPPAVSLNREQLMRFWTLQRQAMDAMKKEGDTRRAIRWFQQALEIDPRHEDSLYYLANCLAAEGDFEGADRQLDLLARINPMSLRAWQRRGALLMASAKGEPQVRRAEEMLGRALGINPEETGSLLLLGEAALARRDLAAAERSLRLACQSNPRSVGGLYLRGYVEWKSGDKNSAVKLLAAAQEARGPEWKPKGSVSEGDVKQRMDAEAGFLSPFWEAWDGRQDPDAAYREMDRHLRSRLNSAQRAQR